MFLLFFTFLRQKSLVFHRISPLLCKISYIFHILARILTKILGFSQAFPLLTQTCLALLHQESWVFDKIIFLLMHSVLHFSTINGPTAPVLVGFSEDFPAPIAPGILHFSHIPFPMQKFPTGACMTPAVLKIYGNSDPKQFPVGKVIFYISKNKSALVYLSSPYFCIPLRFYRPEQNLCMQSPSLFCSPLPCPYSSPGEVPLRYSKRVYSSFMLFLSHIMAKPFLLMPPPQKKLKPRSRPCTTDLAINDRNRSQTVRCFMHCRSHEFLQLTFWSTIRAQKTGFKLTHGQDGFWDWTYLFFTWFSPLSQ